MNLKGFLDRCVALDHVAGKRLRSQEHGPKDLAGSTESVSVFSRRPNRRFQVTTIRAANVRFGAAILWRGWETTIKSELPFPSRQTGKENFPGRKSFCLLTARA